MNLVDTVPKLRKAAEMLITVSPWEALASADPISQLVSRATRAGAESRIRTLQQLAEVGSPK